MPRVCHSYALTSDWMLLVGHLCVSQVFSYVTCITLMYLYIIRMLLVCALMSPVYHLYVVLR